MRFEIEVYCYYYYYLEVLSIIYSALKNITEESGQPKDPITTITTMTITNEEFIEVIVIVQQN